MTSVRLTLREIFPDGPRDQVFVIRRTAAGVEIVRASAQRVEFGPTAVAYIGSVPNISDVVLMVEDALA